MQSVSVYLTVMTSIVTIGKEHLDRRAQVQARVGRGNGNEVTASRQVTINNSPGSDIELPIDSGTLNDKHSM